MPGRMDVWPGTEAGSKEVGGEVRSASRSMLGVCGCVCVCVGVWVGVCVCGDG